MYKLIRPLLFKLDPESAHTKVSDLGKWAQKKPTILSILKGMYRVKDDRLRTKVLDCDFENPVGLAAGFDKNAELIDLFYALGFGFTEVGSATALGGEGNEKPRVFRIPEYESIVNRMGLNNQGIDDISMAIAYSLDNSKEYPIGLNIAKTHDQEIMGDKAIEDFAYSFKRAARVADYITINISCPNTKEGKTFEDPSALNELLQGLNLDQIRRPALVKLSPGLGLDKLEKLLDVCSSHDIDGYVVSNTRPYNGSLGKGGLSGKPLDEQSTEGVRRVYRITEGTKPIMGVGGINSAESAYEKIKAGASLIQLYTGLVYEGPSLVKRINKGLLKLLDRDGFKSIEDARGKETE